MATKYQLYPKYGRFYKFLPEDRHAEFRRMTVMQRFTGQEALRMINEDIAVQERRRANANLNPSAKKREASGA